MYYHMRSCFLLCLTARNKRKKIRLVGKLYKISGAFYNGYSVFHNAVFFFRFVMFSIISMQALGYRLNLFFYCMSSILIDSFKVDVPECFKHSDTLELED